MTASTTSTWAVLTASGAAHRVQPAGGDTTWRTGCGRILHAEPQPAPAGARRCGRCVAHDAGALPKRPAFIPRRAR